MLQTSAITWRSRLLCPWRSASLGWFLTLLVLIGGVPLFLCMPPWNDVTLHDMAVRSMLKGGVHYRDVFDTNLPGIDWAMAAIRATCGWSYEALRAWDLIIMGTACWVLGRWSRRAGGTSPSLAWYAVAVALYYPFTSEFNHCQRDPWLLLPAVIAAWMRACKVSRALDSSATLRNSSSILEGFVWGLAVWIKPHVVIPAGMVWLTSVPFLLRSGCSWRRLGGDFACLVVGGSLAGGIGITWLVLTGAWPHFWDVFTNWNPEYVKQARSELPERYLRTFDYFPPWSLLHGVAIPLSLVSLWEARIWSRQYQPPSVTPCCHCLYQPAESERLACLRALLVIFYLGWMTQALLLQKGFDYVHVPETLMALAVLASHRWSVGFLFVIWFAVTGLTLGLLSEKPQVQKGVRAFNHEFPALYLEQHPLSDPRILALWPRCWSEGSSPELRDQLGQYIHVHCGTNWEDLSRVAEFLRSCDPPVKDHQLTCWHDGTHPLYLMLQVEPSTRYMHFGTALAMRSQSERIRKEVTFSQQRYVVSDLRRMTYDLNEAYAPGANDNILSLPAWFPISQRSNFPWNQPIVFRAGRYVVHEVKNPIGPVDIPRWEELDQLGPGEVPIP